MLREIEFRPVNGLGMLFLCLATLAVGVALLVRGASGAGTPLAVTGLLLVVAALLGRRCGEGHDDRLTRRRR